MGNRDRVDHNTFCSLGILNIENRVKQLRLNLVHKIFHNKIIPAYLTENFRKISDLHYHSTRHSEHNFYIPSVVNQQSQTFYYNAIKDWNALPSSLKGVNNIHTHTLLKLGLSNIYLTI